MISFSCRNLTMLSMSQAGFFSGIWCTPMVSSLCVIKCPQSQIMWIGVSSFSPQSLQDTSPSGGLLIWSTMADCLRRNANPKRNLAIRRTTERACFNSWSLFGWSGVPGQTLALVLVPASTNMRVKFCFFA
jgi:hypothetical protein